jgi:glycine/D-amino acid oxidase-like deaminating enzyme
MMKLVAGDPYWIKINKIPCKHTYLSEDICCDVAIIGGGVTGAICAYYFSRAGITTVMVDKNIVGYGSTSASTSILQYEIDNDLVALKDTVGIENAVNCFKLCENAVYEIKRITETDLEDDCGYTQKECFYYTNYAVDSDILRKEFDLRKNHGFDVEFIDETLGAERFSFPVKGGIYSKRGAAEIDSYRFTQALVSFSIRKGLKLFENTEITNILPSASGVELETRNYFKIKAKKVIIATGFEGSKYIQKPIVNLSATFTVVTNPIEDVRGWFNRCIIRDTNNPYTYLRSTVDNRIMVGGEDIVMNGFINKLSDISQDEIQNKYNTLKQHVKTMFPDLNDLKAAYSFHGLFGDTKDSLPYIGEYKAMPGCYFCLGYGANGILYTVFGAQMLLNLYKGIRQPELDIFTFDR